MQLYLRSHARSLRRHYELQIQMRSMEASLLYYPLSSNGFVRNRIRVGCNGYVYNSVRTQCVLLCKFGRYLAVLKISIQLLGPDHIVI